MLWPILGCIAAVLIILAWWHRVLLTLWCAIVMLWVTNRVLNKLLPKRLYDMLVNGPVFHVLIAQLHYATRQLKGIGGHCFEKDD